jgi:hypothetical protein
MKVNEVQGIHAKFILNQLEAVRNSNLRLGFGSAAARSRRLLSAA